MAGGAVDSVVDLFSCLDGYFVDLGFVTDWLAVQLYINRFFLAVPALPREGREGGGKEDKKNLIGIKDFTRIFRSDVESEFH